MLPLPARDVSLYSRQMLVPGYGPTSQRVLGQLRVLLVGAGGLGCPAALYLVRAGVGHLTVMDGDRVEESNLHRQVLHGYGSVGASKAHSLVGALQGSGGSGSMVTGVAEWLSVESAARVLPGHHLVVDATDNAATRYLLNDACHLVPRAHGLPHSIPLISGAALGLDGQLSVHHWEEGGGCYRCLFPVPPPPTSFPPCSEAGVLGPVTGMVGCLMALEVLKCAAGWGRGEGPPFPSWPPLENTRIATATASAGEGSAALKPASFHTSTLSPTSRLICLDVSEPKLRSLGKPKGKPQCPLCGESPNITTLAESLAWIASYGLHGQLPCGEEGREGGEGGRECPLQGEFNGGGVPDLLSSTTREISCATEDQMNRARVGGGGSGPPPPILLDIRPDLHRDMVSPTAIHVASLPFTVLKQTWVSEGVVGARRLLTSVLAWERKKGEEGEEGTSSIETFDREVLVLCRRGVDSREAVGMLVACGVTRAANIEGGLGAWGRAGDATCPPY